MTPAAEAPWADAAVAAAIFAVDPMGAVVRARAGPARDTWLAMVRESIPAETPWLKMPAHIDAGRLAGGLDLAATLRAGRPVVEEGVLAAADGGVLLLAMAERIDPMVCGILVNALDTGEVVLERDGITARRSTRLAPIALDEGADEEEGVGAALNDRLPLLVDLTACRYPDLRALPVPDRAAVAAARERLGAVRCAPEWIESLTAAALQVGVRSLRPAQHAVRVARAAAALDGAEQVEEAHAALATRLVIVPRALFAPAPPADDEVDEAPPPEPEESADPTEPTAGDSPDSQEQRDDDQSLADDDLVVASAAALLPPQLLEQIRSSAARAESRGGRGRGANRQAGKRRGRPVGTRRGEPAGGERLNTVETLRAAAPWQRLRRGPEAVAAGGPRRIEVRPEDFRVTRFKQRNETATLFVVDASGSAAAQRLAEAKGAVELMLADCYVSRDRVALINFRGATADVLLEPTRSLVRAKKTLAAMPAGGGTPLAAAIDTAVALAERVARDGARPRLVFLTDGRANVARDGQGGAEAASRDALESARLVRAAGYGAVVIDVSRRARPFTQELAATMSANYVALPYADAATIAAAARGDGVNPAVTAAAS